VGGGVQVSPDYINGNDESSDNYFNDNINGRTNEALIIVYLQTFVDIYILPFRGDIVIETLQLPYN